MDKVDGQIQFSANDLVNHLACRHLTELNHEVASDLRVAPGGWDPALALLRERGLAHEQAYIEHLKDQGVQVTVIEGVGVDDSSFADTMAAMRAGDQVIYQAALRHGCFAGRADIMHRVDVPSALGEWSYEVTDTKLARDTRSGTILQLSLYSDLVGALQGELCSASTTFAEKSSISFAGSPPRPHWPGPVVELHRSGSWGRQTPG